MKHTNYHNPIRSLTGTALTLVLLTLRAAGADPLDTWILRNPLPTPNNFQCVAYLNGRFLAGGDYDTIVSSPDGIHWSLCNTGTNSTQGTYNPHTSVKSITYGNGVSSRRTQTWTSLHPLMARTGSGTLLAIRASSSQPALVAVNSSAVLGAGRF